MSFTKRNVDNPRPFVVPSQCPHDTGRSVGMGFPRFALVIFLEDRINEGLNGETIFWHFSLVQLLSNNVFVGAIVTVGKYPQ